MPNVSIIVPVYGVERYLPRCVDSILAQTYGDFELILVDDGSPDGCPGICDAYGAKDDRVVVIHQENGGVSSARNAGLDLVRGTYIAFCDGDDYWDPRYLENLVNWAGEQQADMVICRFFRDAGAKGVQPGPDFAPGTWELTGPRDTFGYLTDYILGGKHGWEVWTRLFRAHIVRKHSIRFCTACENYGEDMAFTLEYGLYAKKICCVPYRGYYYRSRADSMMASSRETVKLSQVNEVSAQVGRRFAQVFAGSPWVGLFPVLHLLILYTEYRKVLQPGRYGDLPREIRKIRDRRWYRRQVSGIFRCGRYLEKQYGKRRKKQIFLFSHYCLHGNWKRFRYESAIAYGLWIKEA